MDRFVRSLHFNIICACFSFYLWLMSVDWLLWHVT